MIVFDDDEKDVISDGRSGLEAGAGLEIEDDTTPENDLDFDSDDDTPTWLKSGRRPEEAARTVISGDEDFEPEANTESSAEEKAPTWIEIDAEFWAEEGEAEEESDTQVSAGAEETETEEAEETPKKPVVVHESKRTRRTLIIVAAVAACICGISTYMFMNGIGPFAPYVQAEAPGGDITVPEEEGEAADLVTAGEGYKDLYELISEQIKGSSGMTGGDGLWDLIPLDEYSTGEILHEARDDGSEDMNGQAVAVREADIVITDGSYIYAINSNNLLITQTDSDRMELISGISQPSADEFQVFFEMFVADDRLIAIRHGLNKSALQRLPGMGETDIPTMSIWYPFGGEIIDTSIDIFDISDHKSPVKIHTLSQSGTYVSSRMVGDHLYLITTYYGDVSQMKATDPKTFVPLYSRDGEQFIPDESDIIIPPGSQWPCYTVIAGIDVMGSGDYNSLKAVYGDVGNVYLSSDAVYLARVAFEETKEPAGTLPPAEGTDGPSLDYLEYINWSETLLTKLSVESGKIKPQAQAKVPGYIVDQFSMDEYDGLLRLLTTVDHNTWFGFKDSRGSFTSDDWARLPSGTMEMTNAVYILDDGLIGLGKNEDIAPGERVNSIRYVRNFAYFTTYNISNPMSSMDLSDPTDPVVIGATQVERFSDFLRPYTDGRLFGLGREIDRDTGLRKDRKLVMYDNSDPADVNELFSLVVGDEYSAVEQNHKAILVSASKSLIAIPANGKYLIFGYDDQAGFEKKAEIKIDSKDLVWAEVRGLFIRDTFYVVSPNYIYAYDIDNGFKQSGSLRVDEGANTVDRWNFIKLAGNKPEGDKLPDGVVLDENV